MKRIIIVFEYGSLNGGAAKIAIQTAMGLAEHGYDVTYFCACGPVDKELESKVSRVICLNQYDIADNPSRLQAIRQGIWNKKAYKALNALLDTYQNDDVVVHIHGYSHILSASIIKACMKHHVKPVITLHEYFSICPNGGFYNYPQQHICAHKPMSMDCIFCNCDSRSFLQKCYRVLRQFVQDKYIRNNPNIRYLYISEFSFSKMKKYLKSTDFHYVHNPVEALSVCRNPNADLFVFIGRLSPEKGIDLFCKALCDLGLKGIAIGDGPLKPTLQKAYSSIAFPGWKTRTEIQEILCNAKCLVFPPKWYETDGLVVQECLSAGIPCIVPDNCAASDYITHGKNGYLFESGNIEDLKEKIAAFNLPICQPCKTVSLDEYIKNLIPVLGLESR